MRRGEAKLERRGGKDRQIEDMLKEERGRERVYSDERDSSRPHSLAFTGLMISIRLVSGLHVYFIDKRLHPRWLEENVKAET